MLRLSRLAQVHNIPIIIVIIISSRSSRTWVSVTIPARRAQVYISPDKMLTLRGERKVEEESEEGGVRHLTRRNAVFFSRLQVTVSLTTIIPSMALLAVTEGEWLLFD